jgi:D-sedoheptulose 7-phosphate isomerase
MQQRIYELFQRSIEAKMNVGEALAPLLELAANTVVQALLEGKKILVCGNGHSSALAQIFVSCLIDQYDKERPSLPALWLGSTIPSYTAVAAESHHAEIYAKPIRALGNEGDVLLVISASGNAGNLLQAVTTAHERGLQVIALTGGDDGDIASLLDVQDIEICVQVDSRTRIHEIHLLCLYSLCDLIDHTLFGMD